MCIFFPPKYNGVLITGEDGTEANVTGNDGVIVLVKLSQQKLMHVAHLLRWGWVKVRAYVCSDTSPQHLAVGYRPPFFLIEKAAVLTPKIN